MAVSVTVPRLGLGSGDPLVAEWCQPDGSPVQKGDVVVRLEVDFVMIDVEAEEDGILQHRASPGSASPEGGILAVIVAPDEKPSPPSRRKAIDLDTPPPPRPRRARQANPYPLADVLRAGEQPAVDPADDIVGGLPWDLFPAPEPVDQDSAFAAPEPVLLFPRIVSELKKEEEEAAADDGGVEGGPGEVGPSDDSEPEALKQSEPAKSSAWELVPGEADFNPEWLLERATPEEVPAEKAPARDRFQASSIRSLALGKARDGKKAEQQPAAVPEPEPAAPSEPEPQPVARPKAQPAAAEAAPEPPAPPMPIPVATAPASPSPGRMPETVVPATRSFSLESALERRGEYAPGPPLFLRTAVEFGEAIKMRDQLTREWLGSNIRPLNEDIVLRAIARALHESAAFRRRTDVVGLRPLAGATRTVHLLADAATRPFRDAVASLAALRETAGADMPCVCTLTSFADFDLDEAVPALPNGQPLAFAIGSVQDVARYRGAELYRATVLTLTLAYDSDAMPDGAAARLLARVRELVEAPYALLAD